MNRVCSLAALSIAAMAAFSADALAITVPFNGTGFVIRNATSDNSAPPISGGGSSFSATISLGGQKAGFGTSYFDGKPVSSLLGVSYNRDDSGTGEIYSNLWVTDGTHYALLSPRNVASNDGYTSSSVNGIDLQASGFGVYGTDTSDLDWLFAGAYFSPNRNLFKADQVTPITLADIGHLTIASPTFPGYGLATSGDPQAGFGFQLIFGDTQSNHLNGIEPYQISNVTLSALSTPVPLPTAALSGTALMGAMALRRRREI